MSSKFIKEETNNSHGGLMALVTLEHLSLSQREIFNVSVEGYSFQYYHLENGQGVELDRVSDALEFSYLVITQRENTALDFLFNFYHKSETGIKSIIFQLPSKLIPSENIRIEKNPNNQGYWDYHIKFPWKMFFDESLKYAGIATKNQKGIFQSNLYVKIKSRSEVFSIHFGVREIYLNTEERREIMLNDYFEKYRYFHYLTIKKNTRAVGTKYGLSGLIHGFFIYCQQWKKNLKKLSLHVGGQPFFTVGCYDIINLGKIISDDVFYFPFDFKSSYDESKHGCINLGGCDNIYVTLIRKDNLNEGNLNEGNEDNQDVEIYILADNRLEWKVHEDPEDKNIRREFRYCFERKIPHPVVFSLL